MARANRRMPHVIGIAGDSGSGKSELVQRLIAMIGDAHFTVVCMDGYHKETRRQRMRSGASPLDPAANDLVRARQDLQALKDGRAVRIPLYDHATGELRDGDVIRSRGILVVEGLHILYPELRPLIDFGIFLDPDPDIKRLQKIQRDVAERGYDERLVIDQIAKREGLFEKWILPQRTAADLSISVTRDSRARSLPHVGITFQNRAVLPDFKRCFWNVVGGMADAASDGQPPVHLHINGERVRFAGAFDGRLADRAENALAAMLGLDLDLSSIGGRRDGVMHVYDCLALFCALPSLLLAGLPAALVPAVTWDGPSKFADTALNGIAR